MPASSCACRAATSWRSDDAMSESKLDRVSARIAAILAESLPPPLRVEADRIKAQLQHFETTPEGPVPVSASIAANGIEYQFKWWRVSIARASKTNKKLRPDAEKRQRAVLDAFDRIHKANPSLKWTPICRKIAKPTGYPSLSTVKNLCREKQILCRGK